MNVSYPRLERGIAMAIVLWFLAAMSLLVAGIVYEARADIKLAQMHSARAKAEAAGDGAVQLIMAALMSDDNKALDGDRILYARYIVGGQAVEVNLVPQSGLIDLNAAGPEVLRSLFEVNAGLEANEAQSLVENLISYRRTRLTASEDFLRIEGASRAILDDIRDSIRVGAGKTGRFELDAAPANVLNIIAAHNPDRVTALEGRISDRDEGGQQNNNRRRSNGEFRADARVTVGDKIWLRRRWVSTERANEGSLPWRITRSERTRMERSG